MKRIKTKIGIVAVVFTVGIAAVALAHGWNGARYGGYTMGPGMMGYGPGYNGYMMGPGMMGYGPGYGGHMMGYGPYGYGNLSPQDAAKLEQSQETFFNDTSDLRNSIQEKQFALNQELQQANPDQTKVTNLQKELSQLESQFDQKALQHQLDLRKNFPDNALSMGYGRGGYCW
ncbi:MAG: periplasmic heavy metal sensor [Desulfobacterales bacterium]